MYYFFPSRNPVVPCDAITIPIVDLTSWKEESITVGDPLSSNAFHGLPSGPTAGPVSGHIFPSPGFTLRQHPFLHRCPDHILRNVSSFSLEYPPNHHRKYIAMIFLHTSPQATQGQPCVSQEEQGKQSFNPSFLVFYVDLFFLFRSHRLSTITTSTASIST